MITSIVSAIIGTASCRGYAGDGRDERAIQGVMILPLLIPEVALGIALLVFFNSLNLPLGISPWLHPIPCFVYPMSILWYS